MKKPALAAALLLVAAAFSARPIAQARPNFSGKWTLDLDKSDFGPMPGPDTMSASIDHKDPDITMSTTQKSAQGEISETRHLSTDGKPTTNKVTTGAGEQTSNSTTKWDGNKLLVATRLSVNGSIINISETWELSADGKNLSISREIEALGGFPTLMIFKKQ
jgi:hypothetical protein